MSPPRTRRSLLGNTVAGLATGAVMGGCAITIATPETLPIARETDPDASLLAACADFDALERRSIRAYAGATTLQREARADRIVDVIRARQRPLLDRILEHRCLTLEGLRAKARTLVLWDGDVLRRSGYWNSDMRASLIGDLLSIDPFDAAQASAAQNAVTEARL